MDMLHKAISLLMFGYQYVRRHPDELTGILQRDFFNQYHKIKLFAASNPSLAKSAASFAIP
jgi:hypothetical protein